MGQILQGKCPHCGYQTKLYLGGGLQDCNPQAALAEVPEDQNLEQAFEQGAMFRIERQPAVCDLCKSLVCGTKIRYQVDSQVEKCAQGRCPKCRGSLRWPEHKVEDIPCPVCNHLMEWDVVGHWD